MADLFLLINIWVWKIEGVNFNDSFCSLLFLPIQLYLIWQHCRLFFCFSLLHKKSLFYFLTSSSNEKCKTYTISYHLFKFVFTAKYFPTFFVDFFSPWWSKLEAWSFKKKTKKKFAVQIPYSHSANLFITFRNVWWIFVQPGKMNVI